MKRGSTRGKRMDTKVSSCQNDESFEDVLRRKLLAIDSAQIAMYEAIQDLCDWRRESSWERTVILELTAIITVHTSDIYAWRSAVNAVINVHGLNDPPDFLDRTTTRHTSLPVV